jgi:hypothetical protein
MKLKEFTHSDKNGVVSYDGKPLSALTKSGWLVLGGHPEMIHRAAKMAIFSLPTRASAGEMRRWITSYLEKTER